MTTRLPLASVLAIALIGAAGLAAPDTATALTVNELASHRAIYELKLIESRGKSAPQAARGRILYDFSGSVCEGYVLNFRQVSELDSGEGKLTLSDLRTNTWEDGEARDYRFKSENFLDQKLVEAVDGRAQRQQDSVAVTLAKPGERRVGLDGPIVFPTEHMRRILAAAREGKPILEVPVFDGADTGEKVYNTLTVIGGVIAPDQRLPADAAAGQKALAGLKRWPVSIGYFDRNAPTGDQLPIYSIKFEVYENGIARALVLDYNTFSIAGEMTSLEIRETKPCQ